MEAMLFFHCVNMVQGRRCKFIDFRFRADHRLVIFMPHFFNSLLILCQIIEAPQELLQLLVDVEAALAAIMALDTNFVPGFEVTQT